MVGLFSSSSRRMEANEEEDLRVIIDDVLYEFHCPKRETSPDVQIIFFHGMMWGDSNKAYATTWKSVDGSLWPKTWLAEEIPNASILSITYDSSLVQSHNMGRLDLHQITENPIQILEENIMGAESNKNYPTIMVGKDLGCLLIQAVCLKADEEGFTQFLTNLKGFFFYSPFQLGIPTVGCDGKLVKDLTQQMSRPFGKFLDLKKDKGWTLWVLHAANALPRGKRIIDIPEDYARSGSDKFYSANEDFSTITTPQSKKSQNYLYLRQFISSYQTVRTDSRHQSRGTKSLARTESPCSSTMRGTMGKVIVFGKSGSGKSTLCNMLYARHPSPPHGFKAAGGTRMVTTAIERRSGCGWRVTDTIGMGESAFNTVPHSVAIEKLKEFLKKVREDYTYIIYVWRFSRFTVEDKYIWEAFKEIFKGGETNFVVVVTNKRPEWVEANRHNLETAFQGHNNKFIGVDFPPIDEDPELEERFKTKRVRHLKQLEDILISYDLDPVKLDIS